jgi:hypothetical protein
MHMAILGRTLKWSQKVIGFTWRELWITNTCYIHTIRMLNLTVSNNVLEHTVVQLAEALHYKLEGHRSNPNAVTGIFHSLNPSTYIMALGSTQPLKEMSTRTTSSGGGGAASTYGCHPYQVHVPTAWKSGRLDLLKHPTGLCTPVWAPALASK